jgi:hypothetical protein
MSRSIRKMLIRFQTDPEIRGASPWIASAKPPCNDTWGRSVARHGRMTEALRRFGILCLALLLPQAARADLAMPFVARAVPGELCRQAVATAERANAIPPHLLAAIGRVESGRADPVNGAMHPWPWTINAEGEGHFYDSKAQAVTATAQLQSQGVRSIDVGCLQVNLMHHPDAFSSLEQAFDPQANAAWAGRFLRQLYQQTGDWGRAAALYHSATPELGAAYEAKVLAVLPEETRLQTAYSGIGGGLWPRNAIGGALVTGGAMTINSHLAEPRRIMLSGGAGGPNGGGLGRDLAAYRSMAIIPSSRGLIRSSH